MKQKIVAGGELDLLTADELHTLLQELRSGWLRPPQTMRVPAAIGLNASGDSVVGTLTAPVPVYRVPAGYTFRLHRIGFFPDGSSYGAPFTAAAGYLEIQRGGVPVDGLGFGTGSAGLPAVLTWGTADAIDYTNGETVDVLVSAGPASKSLNVTLQGTLEPIVRQ